MTSNVAPIRGINDILPTETPAWQWLEQVVRDVLQAQGYGEIRLPLMERTELFARSIGEVTDIVEKEMYTFEDRNGDSLSLRPEATASCVRAGITHGLFHNQQQRLWYAGPMFRYERPQKGRYRQFHQIGAEAFGLPGPDIDAELILASARIWRRLGIKDLRLELNSLGTVASRQTYRDLLVDYFQDHRADLDQDSQRRLQQNPMRILDSKNPGMQGLIEQAPAITDHLDSESADHFAQLTETLTQVGLDYHLNVRLVRGLDYYTRTVFEWVTDRLGAQGAVCSGGRYDGLVEHLGGKPTPAIGWAMGVERLVELLRAGGLAPDSANPHAYLVPLGEAVERSAASLAESLRDQVSRLRLHLHCGGGGTRARMKKADRSGAAFAIILGEDELAAGTAMLKSLRDERPQESVPLPKLASVLKRYCAGLD